MIENHFNLNKCHCIFTNRLNLKHPQSSNYYKVCEMENSYTRSTCYI